MEARLADYGAGEQAVEDFCGRPGAGAILSGIGWVSFEYTLREQSAILGLAGLTLKGLPMGSRTKLVLGNASALLAGA